MISPAYTGILSGDTAAQAPLRTFCRSRARLGARIGYYCPENERLHQDRAVLVLSVLGLYTNQRE